MISWSHIRVFYATLLHSSTSKPNTWQLKFILDLPVELPGIANENLAENLTAGFMLFMLYIFL